MSHRQRRALATLASLCMVAPVLAESFEMRRAREAAANPPDLHFRLATGEGKTAFRIGEQIPLVLAFASDTPDKYKLDGATYDRSGRLPSEEFVLEREDVVDPCGELYGSGVLGWIGGGLRSSPVLGPEPHRIELTLNDWFRFDRPGRYRLFLKSHRLTRERAPDEAGERAVHFAAVSNPIEIEILAADAAWEAAKLSGIRAILDQPAPETPKPGGPPVPHNPLSEMIPGALRELRYIGTPDAVGLAFSYARKTGEAPAACLLTGARDRARMLTLFEEYLADPAVAIREWDIRIRAFFAFLHSDSPSPLPAFAWQMTGGRTWEKARAEVETRQRRFETILRNEATRLIPIVRAKNDAAREVSATAIAAVAPEAAKASGLAPPDDYGLSREELIAQFAGFPEKRQSEILEGKWDLVRGPEMIPALEAVIARAPTQALPQSALALQVWGGGGIAEAALRRLADLSPSAVERILRQDFASGRPRFAGYAVREFAARDVPEADDALSALMETNLAGALPLVARFASARLAHRVGRRYEEKPWPSAEEEAFVAYFVRTDPERGRDVLARAIARGRDQWLLQRVAAIVWNSAVRRQAIASLDDANVETASTAARVLAAFGGPEVEAPLWKRIERWSEQWRGRAAELAKHPITGKTASREGDLGHTLFEAMGSAGAWIMDEPRRMRLAGLCIDERCREQWGKERPAGPIPIAASSGGVLYPTAFRVEGYAARNLDELRQKLVRYPAGAVFRWCPQAFNGFDAFTRGQRDDMYGDLAGFLAKRSMSIEPYSAQKCGH
jgi:hypothetical protein